MATGRMLMFALGILLVVGARDVSGAGIRCIPPYELTREDRGDLQPYNPESAPNYKCPNNFPIKFGNVCFHIKEYGRNYGPVVPVSFATAEQECQQLGAEVTSLWDLRDPNVLQAVVEIKKGYDQRRALLMFERSCVELSPSPVWGEQLCVKLCNDAFNKMVICRRPAEPDQNYIFM